MCIPCVPISTRDTTRILQLTLNNMHISYIKPETHTETRTQCRIYRTGDEANVDVTVEDQSVPSGNPVKQLGLMCLSEADFVKCRNKDGYFCVTDIIQKVRHCNVQRANEMFRELNVEKCTFRSMQFLRSDGQMGRAVNVQHSLTSSLLCLGFPERRPNSSDASKRR